MCKPPRACFPRGCICHWAAAQLIRLMELLLLLCQQPSTKPSPPSDGSTSPVTRQENTRGEKLSLAIYWLGNCLKKKKNECSAILIGKKYQKVYASLIWQCSSTLARLTPAIFQFPCRTVVRPLWACYMLSFMIFERSIHTYLNQRKACF